jgi:hypothetical protein
MPQGDGHPLPVQNRSRFSQFSGRLELASCSDNLGSTLALRLGLGSNRPLHLLRQVRLLHLDLRYLGAPRLRTLVEDRLKPCVQLLPLRE